MYSWHTVAVARSPSRSTRDAVFHLDSARFTALIFATIHTAETTKMTTRSRKDADRRITRRLKDALSLLGIRVLDHLVVGDRDIVSFAERELL
ncbi:MAG TPA: hypothetical protein ENI62_07875 [Gammaproteobacteria bacterium]|nr:hypothetical protein [Gammaproteobacteria bacterium]